MPATEAHSRDRIRISRFFQKILDNPARIPVFTKLAIELYGRQASDYRNEGRTKAFGLLDCAREVLFDNLTSKGYGESPIVTLQGELADLSDCQPLAPSAFSLQDKCALQGLGKYLNEVLPAPLLLLFDVVLCHGCLPKEADILFSLPKGTTAETVGRQLVKIGAVAASNHQGPRACWHPAYLAFATEKKRPSCPVCVQSAKKVAILRHLLARLGQALPASVTSEPKEAATQNPNSSEYSSCNLTVLALRIHPKMRP